MGLTACPQFCTAGTRTLGGVGKMASLWSLHVLTLSLGFSRPKGAPHKDMHVVPVSLWHDGASEVDGTYKFGSCGPFKPKDTDQKLQTNQNRGGMVSTMDSLGLEVDPHTH